MQTRQQGSPPVNWVPVLFILGYHLLLLFTLPVYLYYYTPTWGMVGMSILLYFVIGMGITGGYHRLYSHKAFRTNPLVETIILFFSTMAAQGSALRWSFEHRLHHAHVDEEKDPYSIKKGFWHAHMLWIIKKPDPIEKRVVADLLKNPLVMFQHNYYALLMVLSNGLLWAFTGWLLNDYVGAFFLAILVRMFCLHHSTWFINSLAHTWGVKPFSQELTAVDNFIISLLTFGEGYHNYHHTFANDYRNGIRWYHFDPTKWLIWSLNKFGLVHSLKRTDAFTIKKRMVLEEKSEMIDRLKKIWYVKSEELESKVMELSDRILQEIYTLNELRQQYRLFKHDKSKKELLDEIYAEMREMKKKIKEDWREWIQLSRGISRLRPLKV